MKAQMQMLNVNKTVLTQEYKNKNLERNHQFKIIGINVRQTNTGLAGYRFIRVDLQCLKIKQQAYQNTHTCTPGRT